MPVGLESMTDAINVTATDLTVVNEVSNLFSVNLLQDMEIVINNKEHSNIKHV